MLRTFAGKQLWVLGVVAVCCASIFVGSMFFVGQMLKATWWVRHTLQVMKESDESLVCMIDCETAYRGYVITSAKTFLEPYEVCKSHVLGHLEALKSLTADNSKQQAVVDELTRTAIAKLEFSAKAIRMRDHDATTRASDVIDISVGKKLMDHFRDEIKLLMDEEQRLYAVRVQDAEALQRELYLVVAFMAVVVAGCIGWLTWSTNVFYKEQMSSRELLAQARDAAIRANELKSQFVANISHEIRTPLSGILGMSELMVRDEKDSERRELVEHIHKSARNLLSIVNDLLDFSKLEAGHLSLDKDNFQLPMIVEHVARSISVAAEAKNVSTGWEIAPNTKDVTYSGDPGRLRQVLLNLAHNAVKFTAEGSVQIKVTAGETNADRIARVTFEVVDSGVGFSSETSAKLFQPFVQGDGSTSRRFGGTGLGLSISKRIVELMGGQIGCRSDGEGKGATFWFEVPLEVENVSASVSSND